MTFKPAAFCEHANESPRGQSLCDCPLDCACRERMCVRTHPGRRARDSRELVSWGTRRGTARGGGQSSKAKGRAAVQKVRDMLLAAFGLQPDDLHVKATSQLGVDLHMSPAAQARFPFGIEVKCVESLNIYKALEQAQNQSPTLTPIVFFKRAHTPMFVALDAAEFLRLLARRPS